MKKLFKGDRVGYLYILPAILFMGALIFYPIIYNFVISMQDVNVMTLMQDKKEFVGLANYAKLFKGQNLWNAIGRTLTFTFFCILFQFTIGFLLAMLFKRETPAFKFMKAVMLVPYIIPATVAAIVFKFFFSVNGGLMNELLLMTGLTSTRMEWLLTPSMAMFAVIVANIWCGIPFNMILLSTGLASIPGELYESAEIDGANLVQRFFNITVPSIKSSIQAVLVLGVVYTFRCFELIYVMTSGGPVSGTEIMTIYSYKTSFVEFNFAQGASIANIMFLILLVIGLFYIRMMGTEEEMM